MSDPQIQRLAVERLPIERLSCNPTNPRHHSARQIRQISQSIESFGFNVPILVDRQNRIIAGHGRLLAGKELGLIEVPVIRIEHLSPAQAAAFGVADNRLTEISSWDDRLLGETLKNLASVELDFSLEATGFDMGEIDLRIEGLSSQNKSGEDKDDALPSPTNTPPISRTGDLWQLGRHRIYCGNALDVIAFQALMGGQKAAMVFVDPPYNVPIDGHVSGLGKIRHREFAMASGEQTDAKFTTFLTHACTLLASHSQAGSIHFVCMDWRHAAHILAAGNLAYSELKNICVWTKHNAGMGSFYRSQHELVFVFKSGRRSHRNNIQLGEHGRNRSNVWPYPSPSSFGRVAGEDPSLALHPTVKPVQLVADAILDCSARNDVVLDCFLGSGTTLIAAERTGRRCYGIEIDPQYVDMIIQRWQVHTGDQALHARTGKTFECCNAEGSHAGRQ